ncbi:MAG: hypothetical protein RJA91_123 [Pseudomonadota bacterium]|jgi:hypothetical protein
MADEIIGIKVTTDAQSAVDAMTELDQSTKKTDESVKSLRAQLKEATANVAIMSDKFGSGSKQATEAAKRAAELKDRIGDAKLLTDAFNPDAKFKAVASALSGVAGGFSAVQGAMALFGSENKKVEQALLRVNAAMALTQGLNAIGESIDAFDVLSKRIQANTTFMKLNNAATQTAAAVTKAFGISVETTSTGFKVLKGAIVATGIGALVLVLGEVIANFDAISKWIKSSPLGALATGVGNLIEKFTDFVGITSEAQRNLDAIAKSTARGNEDIANRIKILEAQGGKEKEIHDLKLQQTENELNVLRESLKVKGELTDEEAKKFRDLKTQQEVISAEYNKKVADDDAKARKEKEEKDQKAREKAAEANKKHQEEIAKDTETGNKLLLELQNDKALAEIESETDKAKKKLEIDAEAKKKEIDSLKISEDKKVELRKAVDDALVAQKAEVDKKAAEEQKKKNEEEEKTEKEFRNKISDIKIAAIKNDTEQAIEERKEQLKRDIEELEADKEFIKLSEEEKAKIKKDLIVAAEQDIQKAKNDETKKGLQNELEVLQAQQKTLSEDSREFWKITKEIEENAYKQKLLDAGDNAKEIEKINKEHSANNIQIERAEKEARLKILKDRLGSIEQFGKDIQTLAGKNKKLAIAGLLIERGAALAQVAANTGIALTKSVAASPLTLGLPWSALIVASGVAQAAVIVKSAVDSIKQINAAGTQAGLSEDGSIGGAMNDVSMPSVGGGGGGALPSTGGGGAPSTEPDRGNPTRQDTSGGGSPQPIKVYVSERDISDTQERVRVIQENARFE